MTMEYEAPQQSTWSKIDIGGQEDDEKPVSATDTSPELRQALKEVQSAIGKFKKVEKKEKRKNAKKV